MFVTIILLIVMIGAKSTSAQFGFGGGGLPTIDVTQTQTESNEDLAKKYFKHYGYTLTMEITDAEFDSALSSFRSHHELNTTGSLSSEDMAEIKRARCSMPDKYDLFTDPNKPLVETDVDEGRRVIGTGIREWDVVAIVKRQATPDDTFLQCQSTINPITGSQKRMFTWCLAWGINGFNDFPAMRATITEALDYWKEITQLDFAEISCPGQTGFWIDECPNNTAVCNSADFKFAFGEMDGPGGDLSLACSITTPGGPLGPVVKSLLKLRFLLKVIKEGYIFFDALEGNCPNGLSRWILEAQTCPQSGACEQWSWHYVLVHNIGHLLGMEECGSGVMNAAYQCVVGDIPVDPCITEQIERDCPHYNLDPICDQFCDKLEDPEGCNADCDVMLPNQICIYAPANVQGDNCQLCTMGRSGEGFNCNETSQSDRIAEHTCCQSYCRSVYGAVADGRCTQSMDQCVCSTDGTPLSIWGEPAYRTGDGRTFSYHGTCRVLALQPCASNPHYPDFAIYQKNYCVKNCNPEDASTKVSSALWIELEVFGQRFRLSKPLSRRIPVSFLDVNHQPVGLPFVWSNDNGEFVRATHMGVSEIFLYTSFGVKIWTAAPWYAREFQIRIPDSPGYINNTCGIFGMFNKDPTDDFRYKNGSIVTIPSYAGLATNHAWKLKYPLFEEYGDTWIEDIICDINSGKPLATCDDVLFGKAEELCSQIKNETGPFGQCIAYFNALSSSTWKNSWTAGQSFMGGPESFYEQCLYDVCQLNNTESALENGACDSYTMWENACRYPAWLESSPVEEWRKPDFCSLNCEIYPFAEEVSCATKCPRTCTQPNAPERCSATCAAGCQCIAGYFWQSETASCILEVACPVQCLM